MMRRLLCLAAGLVLVATSAGCDWRRPAPTFQSTDITGVEWGRDFHLTDHHGTPRSVADFRGKVVLVFFGYTHCPDMCPTSLAKMAAVVELLGKQGERVQGIFITVDPARDTAEVLAKYVPAFHPTFIGLRGDTATTAKTAESFKLFFKLQAPDSSGNYTVDHFGAIFALDPQGRLRLLIRPHAAVDAIAGDLNQLLDPS